MSKDDLISIVVPIYNVEKYLRECIISIIEQTYKNIEIILVDDGSPDNCGIICDEYAKNDSRIKVLHKPNGGLSDARNNGIDIATGKYICFVDSDDYINKYYVEKLYNAINNNNVEIAQCNILKVNDEKQIIKKIGYDKCCIKSGREIINEQYSKHVIENIVVWNKIYKKELFNDIRFPIGKIHEDEFITYKILYNLDRIAIINDFLYIYRENENSITNKGFNIRKMDRLDAYKEKMYFFKEKDKGIFIKALIRYIEEIKNDYIKSNKYLLNFSEIKTNLLKDYRKAYRLLIIQKEVSVKYKIKMLIFYLSPKLQYFLKHLKNIIKS